MNTVEQARDSMTSDSEAQHEAGREAAVSVIVEGLEWGGEALDDQEVTVWVSGAVGACSDEAWCEIAAIEASESSLGPHS